MNLLLRFSISILAVTVLAQLCLASSTGNPSNSTAKSSTTVKSVATEPQPTPTEKPVDCGQYNKSCNDCVNTHKCYYCGSTKRCWKYDPTIKDFIPPESQCVKNDSFIGQCLFSTLVLLIAVPSAAGVLLISLGCLIYCCCCRNNKRKVQRDQARFQAELDRRKDASDRKKAERQAKRDDIRRKYGLFKDGDDSMYTRMA
uniref:PTTG1IP n=2 Tax=unclassified Trichoplax TaxID=2636125 RepID=Q3I7B3_9METZ|nr:PTTG1IP [Trichoplax sp. BZE8]ABA43352.1 PTTG1IP [Trichoplax sp. BZ264]